MTPLPFASFQAKVKMQTNTNLSEQYLKIRVRSKDGIKDKIYFSCAGFEFACFQLKDCHNLAISMLEIQWTIKDSLVVAFSHSEQVS